MNKRTGKHQFNFDTGVCDLCAITEEHWADNGKPPCPGRKRPRSAPNASRRSTHDEVDSYRLRPQD